MTRSARNPLQRMIEEIQMGDVLAHVTVRVAGGITRISDHEAQGGRDGLKKATRLLQS